MNSLWNRLLNYLSSDCFWCGKRVYLYYSVTKIGTVEHKMHDGPIQNCADQYSEWQDRPTYIGEVAEYHTSLPY